MKTEKRLMTAKEAATFLGLSARTVWNWALSGKLPTTRLGRKVMFDRRQLEEFIQEKSIPVSRDKKPINPSLT